MKIWIVLLMALIVGGCASPKPYDLPNWEAAARDTTEIAEAKELPILCSIPRSGQWTVACWRALSEYDIIAAANYDIARSNALALGKTEAAYDHLIEAGKLQQQLATIREEMLEQERREHTYDNWFYRALIVVGLAAFGAAQ